MSVTTPTSERVHVAIFGRTNAGKSSLINALTGQDVALVSPEAGTTTDPVNKAMELPNIGAAVIIDTPGLEDNTTLGESRMARTAKVLDKADIAIILFTEQGTDVELALLEECRIREITTVVVLSKVDNYKEREALIRHIHLLTNHDVIAVSATTGEGIDRLFEALAKHFSREERMITEGFCEAGDMVLLVMPQDKSAPKGRLIQPQVQTIRELLDRGCTPLCCTPDTMAEALAKLNHAPKLIITDSQAFDKVYMLKPAESVLTSFSILFARYKGDIDLFIEGAKALGRLTPSSRILIAEACTHAPQSEDIGRVKLPAMLHKRFGAELLIDIVGGMDYPEDLTPYDLVIHCGACMFNRKHVLSRVERARKQGVAITNYGIIIAALTGILERVKSR